MITRYLSGVRLLVRGLTIYVRTPRLLFLGLIPAVVTALLFAGVLGALLFNLGTLTEMATWFAAGWSDTARTAAQVLIGIALVGAAVLLVVLTYTSVTLLIGGPFYEAIARDLDAQITEAQIGFWRGLRHNLADSLRLLATTLAAGVGLFLLGVVPVVGQTAVPVAGAAVGGWSLALQLTGPAFDRRGLRLAERRRLLRSHRPEALGLGMATFCCFLIPGGAILLMPAAVAAGTLLARSACDDAPPAARSHEPSTTRRE